MKRTALVLLTLVTIGPLLRAQPRAVAVDRGSAGAWQAIQKLRTFASVLHTTAHPDDEHGGVLTWLSRGLGARVGLLTLTRGESGDNAIGSELFDALGLIRTEELRAANRYYGVDQQYFTSAVDYGFSKRVSEAWSQWARTEVLEEVVRVIRMNRPLVIVSRFQGRPRDGHGQHIAAGEITQEAFHAAADPERFPEQLAASGLGPWQANRLFVGGVRMDEPASVEVNVGQYSPWLGLSYRRLARLGLSLQRSQNAGLSIATPGAVVRRYQQIWPLPGPEPTGSNFFQGLQTGWESLAHLAGSSDSALLTARGRTIGGQVEAAAAAFTLQQPANSVPALAAGLRATRELLAELATGNDAAFLLRTKERQFEHALSAALGLDLFAVAVPPQTEFSTPAELTAVVPGQTVAIDLSLTGSNLARVSDVELRVDVPPDWRVLSETAASQNPDGTIIRRMLVTIATDARLSRTSFTRTTLTEYRYTGSERELASFATPAVIAVARFRVDGVPVTLHSAVRRRRARPPYGYVLKELQVLPAVSLTVRPPVTIVPKEREAVTLTVHVERAGPASTAGTLTLESPPGWKVRPARVNLAQTPVDERFKFTLSRAGATGSEGTVGRV